VSLKSFLALGLFVAATGCASMPPQAAATVGFAEPAAPGGLPGSFRELDGRTLAGSPQGLTVAPGRHRLGYTCPNTLVLDSPPSIVGTFEAGGTYLLRCHRDGPATLERR